MTLPAEKKKAYLAWALVCVVWGTTYLGIKLALDSIPPFSIGALRYLIAGGLLFSVLRAKGYAMPTRAEWIGSLIAGTLLLGIGNGGVIWAELWVPTGLAAVLVACVPFWMVSLDAFLPNGEALTRRSVSGLLIGFAGIVLLMWPNLHFDGTGGWQFIIGIIVLQIACMGWAGGSIFSRRRKAKGDPVMFAATQMLCGGVVMGIAAALTGEFSRLAFSQTSTLALAYLVVAGSLMGYVAYVYALTHLAPSFVSLYAYVNPIVAVALGSLVLGEPFGWRIVFAIAVILTGMFIVSRKSTVASSSSSATSTPASANANVKSAAAGHAPAAALVRRPAGR
jgi:drug/metabolite transporter (DMT)-like permease